MTLPPRGSTHDEILKELFWRERSEKIATVSLMARIVANGLGVPSDEIDGMLSSYTDVITQNRYTPQMAAQLRRAHDEATRQKAADTNRLSKVEKLTVPDGELVTPPKKKQGRRPRRK